MSDAVLAPQVDLYDADLFLWTEEQARLLREKRFDELDLSNLVEEVEGVCKSQRSEIENRLVIIVVHLL